MSEKIEIPTGVKILSILGYISAGGLVLVGLLFTGFGILFISNPNMFGDLGPFAEGFGILGAIILLMGLLSLGLAVLYFFMARGLWSGKEWARILAIVLNFISLLIGIILIFTRLSISSITSIIIPVIVIWYLSFTQEVKEFFNS